MAARPRTTSAATCPADPTPSRPNNVLAPFWTDLDGTGAPGVLVNVLTDRPEQAWIVVEWRVNVFGTTDQRRFQTWIGRSTTPIRQDMTYAYAAPQAEPGGQPFLVGAENAPARATWSTFLPPATSGVDEHARRLPVGTASYAVVRAR